MTKRSIGFPAHSTENEFAKTTRPDPTAAPYVNLLTKADSSQRPREQLVSNIIYVPTYEGWIYLSTVIDLFSCAIMECDLSDFFCVSGTIEAIERTINQVGFIRSGCQYTSQAFRQTITTLGWRQSMSAKGYCYDNTFAESLASFKSRILSRRRRFPIKERS